MKKIVLLALILLACTNLGMAQQRFVSFDTNIPTNWQSNAATPLSLSNAHIKAGGNALIWKAKNGNFLKATDLAIPSISVDSAASSAAQLFIYSPEAKNDTLIFQFFDESGVVKRQGRMLLNYKGWMEFHRSYYYDYSNGAVIAPFNLSEMRITYKPLDVNDSCLLHIDEVVIIGDKEVRIPGPHVLPDYPSFRKNVTNAPYLDVLMNWSNGPDVPVVAATSQELTDLALIRSRYLRIPPATTTGMLDSAKKYVLSYNITTNADGSLNGKGIAKIFQADTLVKIANLCGALARAAFNNSDMDAKAKLILFTEYAMQEGMAEGGRIVMQTNSYPNARTFPSGFLEALRYYPPALREEVVKMLKWSNEYSVLYGATYLEGYSVDYLNIKAPFLVELSLLDLDSNVAVRDLKLVKRFLERNTVASLGGRDGRKPDGVGYHHGSQHTSYMGAWSRWTDLAYSLRGTVYKMDITAYENMSIGMKYLLVGSSKGVLYAHAESGRNPFPAGLPVLITQFEKFVKVGGDIKNVTDDPVMGGIYNDVTGTNKFPVETVSVQGYHQYNYGAVGIQRKNNWVAVMRGFTSKIFSAEIYTAENRYGRYQSYGTLEILYGGTLDATGYRLGGAGWDWNVMPGTTTVHFPDFAGLRPTKTGTAMEFQNLDFAGSLSLGQEGIFGFNFSEKANGNYVPSRLKFRKTVFAFDSILVCLGSGITTTDSLGNVATNFFQGIHKTTHGPIYVNSTTAVTDANYDQTISTVSSDLWLLNAQSTGYYIPVGNGDVRVVRKRQATPKEGTTNPGLPNSHDTSYASKAWMNHGSHPVNGKYHFVVVPGTTPAGMQALAYQFAADTLYDILKQTDSLHVVKYHPASLTSYVFFTANNNVNIGHVKSVSDVSMAGIREGGDTLTLTLNSPDMKITTQTAYNYYWLANVRSVSLVLKGNWDVIDNPSGVSVTGQATTTTAVFSLEHGFSRTIKLKKHVDELARQSAAPVVNKTEAAQNKENAEANKRFRIFPNPAHNNLQLTFVAAKTGMAEMTIMNMQGAVVQSKKVSVKEGQNYSSVNISNLVPGTYIIHLSNGGSQEKGLFVKH